MARQDLPSKSPGNPPKKPVPSKQPALRNLDEFTIKPVSREEERELYTGFYERLYEYFQKGRLDFQYLGSHLNLRERRIRECMLFRLSSGEVMQLFGLKKGYCFICDGRLYTKDTPEPVCLRCLNAMERALEERYGKVDVSHHSHRDRFTAEPGAALRAMRVDEMNSAPPAAPPAPPAAPAACPLPEQLPDDVATLKAELSKCRQTVQQYVEKTGVVLNAQSAQAQPAQSVMRSEVKAPDQIQDNQIPDKTPDKTWEKRVMHDTEISAAAKPPVDSEFLALLEMDESQVPAPEADPGEAIQAGMPREIRHYGFKRFKKKEA